MNIHATNLRGPAGSSPEEGAVRTARFGAAARGEVAGDGGKGASVGTPGLRGGCGATPGLAGPGAPACRPVLGHRLVSPATVLFLLIGTLSGLIIRSLPRLPLLAGVGK